MSLLLCIEPEMMSLYLSVNAAWWNIKMEYTFQHLSFKKALDQSGETHPSDLYSVLLFEHFNPVTHKSD